MKTLEFASFPEIAERTAARYDKKEDVILLAMLGQDYLITHTSIVLHGQQAPENHTAVILDYLFSSGTELEITPWRAIGTLGIQTPSEFRKKVELPIAPYTPEIISRASTLLPMLDAEISGGISRCDMAINARLLPKIYLHAEFCQETSDFPAEAWILFSHNAHEFLSQQNLQILAELFKERLLSLIRIY